MHDANANIVLANRTIHRTDFFAAKTAQLFSLFFNNDALSSSLEFRVFYVCCAAIMHTNTTVELLNPGAFGTNWFSPAASSGSLARSSQLKLVSVSAFPNDPSDPSSAFSNVGEGYLLNCWGTGCRWGGGEEEEVRTLSVHCGRVSASGTFCASLSMSRMRAVI